MSIRRMTRMAIVAALACAPPPAVADEAAAQSVLPAPEYVYCTTCHGVDMGGNSVLAAPRLSGMDAWYVARQLRSFQKGWRGAHPDDAGGHEMRPMAAVLDEARIAGAANYVSRARSTAPVVTVEGDAERGRALYATCAACHGPNAAGDETLASPPLTGLNDWYLLEQLRKFRAGVRGIHPDDSYGQQMRAAAALLADEQAMADVVRHIATLNSQ